MLRVHQLQSLELPALPSVDEILASRTRPLLLAAVDGLSSAENVGVLVRNCAAFGVYGLLVSESSSSPFLRRAVRSSMGAIFQLPIVEVANLAQTLQKLRSQNIRCIAAHPHTDRAVLTRTDLTGDCCIVFGSEGYGLSPAVLAACDEAVAIPMSSGIDSLNV